MADVPAASAPKARWLARASSALAVTVRRLQGTRAGQPVRELISAGYESSENLNHFAIADNGEAWLIAQVARTLRPSRVLDIGANRGEWLDAAHRAMPQARIVACEPQEELAERLRARYRDDARVVVRAIALGRAQGSLPLHCYPGHDSLASAIDWHPRRESRVVHVPQSSGRDLMASLGWDGADLVKVDVEGMEYDVLAGFGEILSSARLGIVQFEFGGFALQQRVLMKDFCELLGPAYRVGRLMPRGVEFRHYDFRWETWALSNFVACRHDLVAMIGEET
jgi:FkbM family methyltransferase